MQITRKELERAAAAGVLEAETAERLWRYLSEELPQQPQFRAAHLLYYLGGFVAMSALALFIGQAWEQWAGWPMLLLAVAFAGLGFGFTHWFLERKQLQIPAGVMVTFAVSMVPLAVYSLQHALGFWDGRMVYSDYHRYIDWRWFYMEMATLAAATIALWWYRLPFTVFLVALTLWYLQMDLVPLLFDDWAMQWEMRKLVSLIMGLAMIGLAFWVDIRSGRRRDFAFWLYLAGVAAFWGGLTAMNSDSELSKFFYLCINLAMLATGAALRRRVFAVFGGIGVALYLGHLATLFEHSLLFPVALALIGIGVVFAGVQWQRHEARLTDTIRGVLPTRLRMLIDEAHERG
ncbi:MAG: DUF2157 domain-containing protein [Ectothiorhodospiraceae bacterium]|nr:DUF2157 domain-containing protein [Ectothiorhodospiraceae bacterium]MCH8502994.1 DUF2157 domain-containing protein [Ectothiorhodospiraceae bacterium]